jgi:hypothetical protein
MKPKHVNLNVTLCGPGDVSREIKIAEKTIEAWNLANRMLTGCSLICQHWSTHSAPDMGARGQQVIDHQMIDKSDLVIAVFWARLGTPTGLADSGTVEEVQRAMARGIRVMVYFSDLVAPMHQVDEGQLAKLEEFRRRVMNTGLASSFSGRKKFEEDLHRHLGMAVADILASKAKAASKKPSKKRDSIIQGGSRNTQVVGDNNTIYATPAPAPRIVLGPVAGQVTAAEQAKVLEWLDELAVLSEKLMGKTLGERKTEWRSRLVKKFRVPRYNALMSDQIPKVEEWFLAARGRFLRSSKAKKGGASAAQWKTSIKTKMKAMSRTNEDYYPEIADRLKIPRFTSLTDLSPTALEKVYDLVGRDARKKKGR